MAREPEVLARGAWKPTEESRQAYLAFLVSVGDVQLASYFERHPSGMDGLVWAFIRGDTRALPPVSVVLDQAAEVAARELWRARARGGGAGAVVDGVRGVQEWPTSDGSAIDEWWRERVAALARNERDAKAFVAACKSALEGRRGVFEFDDSEWADG